MSELEPLTNYIKAVTGAPAKLGPVRPAALAALPVYLSRRFDIRELYVFDHTLVIALVTAEDQFNLTQLVKQRDTLADKLGRDVILVLPRIRSHERNRLILKQIPFIVPGRQMYLPMMLVDLREAYSAPARAKSDAISWVAQVILLRHLQFSDIEEQPLSQIALSLGYSAMAISQALDELVALKLCQRKRLGRTKFIQVEHTSQKLWARVEPLMRSPAKKSYYIQHVDSALKRPLQAGMTALAAKTDLVDNMIPTLAMSVAEFRKASTAGLLSHSLLEDDAEMTVQAWAYAPQLLSSGPMVDELSLYLTLRDDPDERVQIALDKLVENFR